MSPRDGRSAGSALIALLTSLYLVPGTLTALYAIEVTLAAAFWTALLIVVRRDGTPAIDTTSAREADLR